MKVIYILSGTGTLGGASKSFLNLLNQVVNKGITPIVVTPNKQGLYVELKNIGIDTIALPYFFCSKPKSSDKGKRKIKYLVKSLLNSYSALNLYLKCKKIHPDIIHSNTSVNDVGYYVAKWLNIPHIWHVREYGDKDFNFNLPNLNKRLKEKGNYSITITKDIASYRHVNWTDNSRVIYNGVVSADDLVNQPIKQPYFLYAGRIEKTKGIDDCVRAFILFKRTHQNNIKLLIAGAPTTEGLVLKEDLIREINSNHLNNYIEWLGSRKDIKSLMGNAIATIVPSHFEGFGRVAAEAMAYGCVVIGRNTGGTKEQFDNGFELTGNEIGLRFTTVEDLQKCMCDVVNMSSEEYKKITTNALTTVNTLYTIDDYGEKVYEFYKYILGNESNSTTSR